MRMQESSDARAMMPTGVFAGLRGFIMGAAMGAAAGVVIGLLLAPKPGRETRQIVGERMGQARERLRRAREPEASDGE
jgi:gas vesicle protein